MQIGIVGLPNVGKSTIFNAITRAGAEAANYPFCTIEPNVGVVEVPDERLPVLASIFKPQKVTPAVTRFVDIAGLVRGASQGEGLGNKFLHHIREVDAVCHVVRCFNNPDVTHVEGSVNPRRDIETINTELILADLETVERRMEKTRKMLKTGEKKYQQEMELLEKVQQALNEGLPVRALPLTEEEKEILRELHLLTEKPVLYVANVGEEDLPDGEGNPHVAAVREIAAAEGAEMVVVCGRIEAEIAEIDDPQERQAFLADLGLTDAGLNRLIRAGYRLLGLITFFTGGEQEVRAWTIKKGTKAPQAAGKIHSDFERGFIRAEIISYEQLVAAGSMAQAREKGLVRLEGRDYVMQDGDVAYFRFNV
ncbi:MAG: ribosome-binding ATPase [Eubacteriales bacterium]|nr:ribosome-binding ATPase [Eubacteriales bacterium]